MASDSHATPDLPNMINKEPLENAAHIRNAIARFNQVKGVADAERETAGSGDAED
jgi:hypothetical protein